MTDNKIYHHSEKKKNLSFLCFAFCRTKRSFNNFRKVMPIYISKCLNDNLLLIIPNVLRYIFLTHAEVGWSFNQ